MYNRRAAIYEYGSMNIKIVAIEMLNTVEIKLQKTIKIKLFRAYFIMMVPLKHWALHEFDLNVKSEHTTN